MGNQAAKQKEGKLTGTAADLRRLKVPALRENLIKAGVPEEVLKGVKRWELVDLLREVANIGEGSSDFARNQRMSAAEMMQRKNRLCQEIWQRQVHLILSLLARLISCGVDCDNGGDACLQLGVGLWMCCT